MKKLIAIVAMLIISSVAYAGSDYRRVYTHECDHCKAIVQTACGSGWTVADGYREPCTLPEGWIEIATYYYDPVFQRNECKSVLFCDKCRESETFALELGKKLLKDGYWGESAPKNKIGKGRIIEKSKE